MRSPRPFDLARTPLEPGTTLLEASAGTGKTYALAGIFVRLLLERRLSVSQILVVTYTEAATAELRGRIRQLLAQAVQALRPSRARPRTADPFLETLAARAGVPAEAWQWHLERALAGFDEAPIYTIHGFCQRVLRERAFEAGLLFDSELTEDPWALLLEVAEDYWRETLYPADPWVASLALKVGSHPGRLARFLGRLLQHPRKEFVPSPGPGPLVQITRDLQALLPEMRRQWSQERQTIRRCLGDAARWARQPYNLEPTMETWFDLIDEAFAGRPTPEALTLLENLASSVLEDHVNKRSKLTAPEHPFFELCEQLARLTQLWPLALHLDFAAQAPPRFARLKQRRKTLTFDDLLQQMHRSLSGVGSAPLVESLRRRYQAALIDEFQDTDPLQYDIFRHLFRHPDGWLFFIGDPKQAIYNFRGADVFAYLEAAGRVDREYTLGTNHRSETPLVEAVNHLFAPVTAPFIVPEITFHPVASAGRADASPLTEAGRGLPPFQLWFWGEDKPVTAERFERQLPELVAAEIVRLLSEEVCIGPDRVRPSHIAILVRKNRQAEQMKEVLLAAGVPAVLHTEASVFESGEAADLRLLLDAVAQPTDERRVRAALASGLLEGNAQTLEHASRDPDTWILQLDRWNQLRQTWLAHGFLAMFERWLADNDIRFRILRRPQGDRRLTNLLHLAELLHCAEAEHSLGPEGLTKWFEDRMATADDEGGRIKAPSEHLLRLERDDEAVRIVTLHKSKGLQYPIVFCPYAWDRSNTFPGRQAPETFEDQVCYHERTGDHFRFVHDLGTPEIEAHRQRAEREVLAENLRLLYVAVTRAIHRCYLFWGRFHGYYNTALHWLLHRPPDLDPEDPELTRKLGDHGEQLTSDALWQDVQGLAERANRSARTLAIRRIDGEPIRISRYEPAAGAAPPLEPRLLRHSLPAGWSVSSFSRLAAGHDLDRPERDDPDRPDPTSEPATPDPDLPRGPRFGTCLHQILERLDFTLADPAAVEALCREQLAAHGLPVENTSATVAGLLQRLVRTPLEPGRPSLRLDRVPMAGRVNELEFHYPVRAFAASQLAQLLGLDGPVDGRPPIRVGDLHFDLEGGFLQGFIDLVFHFESRFYLVDWKSNYLGPRPENYTAGRLREAMVEHHYALQYHLYTVALHRWLSLRLPDYRYADHFGGVCYVFLRGIDPDRPQLGVYRDRPAEARIHRLAQCFGP